MNNVDLGSKIPFGLKNGAMYNPSQVQKGLACGCVCPSCKKPLIAKKGKKNKHHFAHKAENFCATGKETSIHLAAKQIIYEKKSIFLPPLKVGDFSHSYGVVSLDDLVQEVAIPHEDSDLRIIPDLTGRAFSKNIYIEIAVTHFCDDAKKKELKKRKLSTIEIDLSSLLKVKNIDFSIIENIIYGGKHTVWLYNQKLEVEKKKRYRATRKKSEKEAEDRERKRELQKKSLISEYYKGMEKNRRIDPVQNQHILNIARDIIGISDLNDLPSFISEPCEIDALYENTDGRLIRLFIYKEFVLERKKTSKPFRSDIVIKRLKDKYNFYLRRIFSDWYKLMHGYSHGWSYSIDDTPSFNPKKIITTYLNKLAEERILTYSGNYFYRLPEGEKDKNSCRYCGSYVTATEGYCRYCGGIR